MTLENLLIYKGLLFGVIAFLVFWGLMVLPVKMEIRGKVGKPTYRRILKEYHTRSFNKYFGGFVILSGVLLLGLINLNGPLIETLKENWNIDAWHLVTSALALIFFGVYLRFVGFVKAMGDLM